MLTSLSDELVNGDAVCYNTPRPNLVESIFANPAGFFIQGHEGNNLAWLHQIGFDPWVKQISVWRRKKEYIPSAWAKDQPPLP